MSFQFVLHLRPTVSKENTTVIDGAGNMSHFRDTRMPSIAEVRGQLDRLAAIAGQVQATEYDLETEDDTLHADHLRDMLILHFAHPVCIGQAKDSKTLG